MYHSLSRLTSATNPESGTILYGYDGNGNVTSRKDARGITTTYSYDPLNRLTRKLYSDGTTPLVTFEYDKTQTNGPVSSYPIGRLVEASSAGIATTWISYDQMGRAAEEWQCTPLNCSTGSNALPYTYDLMGNMTSYGNGEGVTLTQTFDGAAHATALTSSLNDAQHPANLVSVSHFFPSGAPELLNFANNLQEIHILNTRLQPCRISVTSNASYPLTIQHCYDATNYTTLQDFALKYDEGSTDNGNVVLWVGNYTDAFSRTYTYDALNRISTMADAATTGSCKGLAWVYDAWGNRTQQNATAGSCPAPQLTFNPNNQIMSPSVYTYDASGNMTHDASHSYVYDAENRITKVDGGTTATYSYDAFGHRVEKTVGGAATDYYYNLAGQVIAEQIPAGWSVGYDYFNGASVAKYANGTTYFVHSDHLGSTHVLTNMSGAVYDNYDYLPFGEQIAGGTGTTHKFTQKERDTESGLDNFGARYNSSSIGRFVSPDPLYIETHRLVDPQQWNIYAYARNNPVSLTDSTGLDIKCSGTRCVDYLAALQKNVSFKIGYDKDNKVVTEGNIDKKGLSKSDKAFLSAIDDTKHHVTITAVGGDKDASVFFGASHGSAHTINFDQAALLDSSKNAGGMTSAGLVGHETLEGYDESKGYSMSEGHDYATGLGFPGLDPGRITGLYGNSQTGIAYGFTQQFQIHGTNTTENIGINFVTPIPATSVHSGLNAPGYPVSVEKNK